jgi:capsid protein
MRAMLTLPRGWKLGQVKAEQPVDTYEMFKKLIIQEIARCCNMPYNIAAGDSSNYNYASGRLDHQTYFKSIQVERSHLEDTILTDLFMAWLDEAMLTSAYAPAIQISSLAHAWHWDGFEHVDPLKESRASIDLVGAGLLTLADYHAGKGKDWEEILEQRARENAKKKSLGLDEEMTDGDKAKEAVASDEEEDD